MSEVAGHSDFWGTALRRLQQSGVTGRAASAAALSLALLVVAAPARSQETIVCQDFEAWTLDRSKRGLAVRERPSGSARVIGHLADPEEGMAAMVLVTGYREGWFRIAADDWTPANRRKAGQPGIGWVPARSLMLDIYDPTLRAKPAADAPVAVRLRETLLETRTDNPGLKVHRLLACRDAWKRVSTNRGEGWARDTCGNPVTTCP